MAGENPFLVSLPMASADNVRGRLTTYIDFDSPLGTDIYKAVSMSGYVRTIGLRLRMPKHALHFRTEWYTTRKAGGSRNKRDENPPRQNTELKRKRERVDKDEEASVYYSASFYFTSYTSISLHPVRMCFATFALLFNMYFLFFVFSYCTVCFASSSLSCFVSGYFFRFGVF